MAKCALKSVSHGQAPAGMHFFQLFQVAHAGGILARGWQSEGGGDVIGSLIRPPSQSERVRTAATAINCGAITHNRRRVYKIMLA